MSSIVLGGLYLSVFKDIREIYMHWKILFTVLFWSLSLVKTMEDEYYKEEMFYHREKWPQENKQIDTIIILDTVTWILVVSIYTSQISRPNQWRSMPIV